jgi:hypothetical protein
MNFPVQGLSSPTKDALKSCCFMLMSAVSLFLPGYGGSKGGNSTSPTTPPPVSTDEWVWVSGSSLANQPGNQGTYGTVGTAAPGSVPGAPWSSVGWIDPTGNLWLFGGNGYGSTARASGRGSVDRICRTKRVCTGLWEWLPQATSPGGALPWSELERFIRRPLVFRWLGARNELGGVPGA